MPVNPEVKGTLAKLLATENLNVEHRQVPTAYFEVDNRTLCLPIWKNVSGTVYDLLVGHEVGHALYTPVDYGAVSQAIPQDILNVLEDVRVEKLMKRRYPGLSKSFYHGYNEMNDMDFFEIKEKDLGKMSLIDRINIHYKVGVVGNRTIVPFERDEIEWVNRAAETETWDDLVDLAFALMDYLKQKKVEEKEVPAPQTSGGGDEPQPPQMPGSSNMETQGNSTQGSDFENEDEESTPDGGNSTPIGGKNEVNENVSETQRAMDENQQQLVDERAKEYLYINLPKFDLSQTIVPFKTNVEKMSNSFNAWHQRSDLERPVEEYRKYKKDSIKTVNYLVKEFECKKAADQYARASTSRTGVLDTTRLHTYKFSDDVFKKVTTIPDGKNHGLVFYLDWSGSMSSSMISTIKQLYDLMWFCKKCAIPFRVYAFSDCHVNDQLFPGKPTPNNEGDLNIDRSFRLFEFFSSKMNTQTFDKMMEVFFVNCWGFYRGNWYDYEYSLSGTPLVEAIVSTPQVVEKFKSEEKVQKVNVIYLTDGEACTPCYNKYIPALKEVHSQPIYGDKITVLRDPKSRFQTQINTDRHGITNTFVGYISNIVNYNLLGFRLCSKSEVRIQANYCEMPFDEVAKLDKEWTKNKSVTIKGCGFKELYLIHGTDDSYNRYRYWNPDGKKDSNEIEVKDVSSKSQLTTAFKKHMNGKMVNKVILSKFVGQIA
jgi:hypothetical protein